MLDAAGVDPNFRSNDWAGSSAVAGLVSAVVLLVASTFGGYVAGRGAVVGGVVFALTDDVDLTATSGASAYRQPVTR